MHEVYTPSIRITKIGTSNEYPYPSNFEITIKILNTDLQVYRKMTMAEPRYFADEPNNLDKLVFDQFSQPLTFDNKIVIDMEKKLYINIEAVDYNKRNFDVFEVKEIDNS